MKVLIIDNYDSFTFNLYQYTGEILEDKGESFQLDVKRNDAVSIEEIKEQAYDRIIISPGPGTPAEPAYFGICGSVLKEIGSKTPILGICLGMQGIAHIFGGKIQRANAPMHGKTTLIETDGKGLFKNIPLQLKAMRYHSLIVSQDGFPECLEISAWTLKEKINEKGNENKKEQKEKNGKGNTEKVIMGLRHRNYPMEGIQFHPESFATEAGQQMIANFILSPRRPRPS